MGHIIAILIVAVLIKTIFDALTGQGRPLRLGRFALALTVILCVLFAPSRRRGSL